VYISTRSLETWVAIIFHEQEGVSSALALTALILVSGSRLSPSPLMILKIILKLFSTAF